MAAKALPKILWTLPDYKGFQKPPGDICWWYRKFLRNDLSSLHLLLEGFSELKPTMTSGTTFRIIKACKMNTHIYLRTMVPR